jgi:hypothetical protein
MHRGPHASTAHLSLIRSPRFSSAAAAPSTASNGFGLLPRMSSKLAQKSGCTGVGPLAHRFKVQTMWDSGSDDEDDVLH